MLLVTDYCIGGGVGGEGGGVVVHILRKYVQHDRSQRFSLFVFGPFGCMLCET